MKKRVWMTLLLCLLLVAGLALAGCASKGIVVGKVGNTVLTTKDVDLYANYILLQNGYARSDITDADTMKSLNTNALDTAVTFNLIMQKATEKKIYPLSATNQKDVDTTVSQYVDSLKQQYLPTYQDKAKTDPSINADKEALKDVDAQMKKDGLTMADLTTLITQSKVAQLLMTDITKDIAMTDDEIKAEYDKEVAAQKDSYTKDVSAYETAQSDGATVIVYKPEGYRYVKHILIAMPEDISTQITTAANGGDTDTVKKLREQGLKQIQTKADDVLAQVNNGGDFDALMTKYGEDPGMKQEPESKTGYALGSATNFVQEFKDAALKLAKVGDVTGLVATDFGYHIIKWVSDVPSGPVALADVKEALKAQILKTKQDTAWNAAIAQWKTEVKVEQHPEKIPVVLPSVAPTATAK